jgi:hypothetical protein
MSLFNESAISGTFSGQNKPSGPLIAALYILKERS